MHIKLLKDGFLMLTFLNINILNKINTLQLPTTGNNTLSPTVLIMALCISTVLLQYTN